MTTSQFHWMTTSLGNTKFIKADDTLARLFSLRGNVSMKPLTDMEFNMFSEYLYQYAGINLTPQKKNLLATRLTQTIDRQGFKSFKEYFEYMKTDTSGRTLSEFINRISTNHTYFFREEEHFSFMKNRALPELKLRLEKEKDLRIWSAGCSNGSEPYTIAMLLDDFFDLEKSLWDTSILATDISEKVLTLAKEGIYKNADIEKIPPMWKMKYFKKVNPDSFQVVESIRHNVIYRRLNLLSEFHFKRPFHVIFCRNVMIYFDETTKNKIIQKFYDQLVPGGYLLIGHSETIDRGVSNFEYIMPSVYRREG